MSNLPQLHCSEYGTKPSVCVWEREAVLNESFIVYNYTLMFCADQVQMCACVCDFLMNYIREVLFSPQIPLTIQLTNIHLMFIAFT